MRRNMLSFDKGEPMEQRELTCIGCPKGCLITVTMDRNEISEITGHTCRMGEDYARKEILAPSRIVTSLIRVHGGELPVVSVKTKGDIPKDKIFDVVSELKKITLEAPVALGEVLIADVCGTGVDIVATKQVNCS